MKVILYGEGDAEPDVAASGALTVAATQEDFLRLLLNSFPYFSFEVNCRCGQKIRLFELWSSFRVHEDGALRMFFEIDSCCSHSDGCNLYSVFYHILVTRRNMQYQMSKAHCELMKAVPLLTFSGKTLEATI